MPHIESAQDWGNAIIDDLTKLLDAQSRHLRPDAWFLVIARDAVEGFAAFPSAKDIRGLSRETRGDADCAAGDCTRSWGKRTGSCSRLPLAFFLARSVALGSRRSGSRCYPPHETMCEM